MKLLLSILFFNGSTHFRSDTMNLSKFSDMFDKKKTFRPKKKFQPGTMKYSLHKQAQASLNSGINLRQVVKLPKVSRNWYIFQSSYYIYATCKID